MTTRHDFTAVGLLWLAGNGLRLTILAVPPVIAMITVDLHLSGTEVGVLSALPVVMFAAAALPGSLLIAYFGAVPTLVAGLVIAAIGAGSRGAMPGTAVLFSATFVMGAGIAVMQPALPSIVRQWLPDRIGSGTAIYTNGLLVGEILPVALTIPIVLPLFHGGWEWSLIFWSIPLLIIAALIVAFAPRPLRGVIPSVRPQWWPDWRNPIVWKLGFAMCSSNSIYFCCNAFLPGHLTAAGRPDLIGSALTALNLGQLPASLLLLIFASWVERRLWPFMLVGSLALISVIGIAVTANAWTVAFAGVIGFSCGGGLALLLMLPPFLCSPIDVPRTSAAMFTIGYAVAVIASIVSGAVWDVTGNASFVFAPIALTALPLLLIMPTVDFKWTAALRTGG